MVNKASTINLYKGKEKSFVEKFITWALTLGRVVVILTEAVALAAFLYRFSLDRQLIDLHDKIKQKETIVKLLKKDEDKYRNVQDRIQLAATLAEKGTALPNTFTAITKFTPTDLTIQSVTVSTRGIRIETNLRSISSLTQFVNSLKTYPNVSTVSIDKIENKASTATIIAGISVTFRE